MVKRTEKTGRSDPITMRRGTEVRGIETLLQWVTTTR